jgi:hypothetical protein
VSAIALLTVIACSLPSLSEYAQERPSAAGGAASGGDAGSTNGGSNSGGTPVTSGGGGSANANAGAGATTIDEAGAAGAPVELTPVQGSIVPDSEASLHTVVTSGVPTIAPLTDYDASESVATLAGRPTPILKPYDSTTNGFWDNLVAEQMQARVSTVLLPSRGAYQTSSADLTGPGNGQENPRRLTAWVSALSRANATDQFQAACRLEVASLQDVAGNFHGTGGTPVLDLSVQSDWTDIFWLRGIKPWFDTLPASYWANPLIDISAVSSSVVSNAQGNASNLMSFIATQFKTTYGTTPSLYLDASWFSLDTTLASNHAVNESCPNFSVPSTSNAFTGNCGIVLPGYVSPSYFDSTSGSYMQPSATIPRSTVDAYMNPTFTLETGLGNALEQGSPFTILYSYTDVNESAGVYRSSSWDYPNHYLNLIRRYGDLPTQTVLLQAENADKYFDTTAGNSGGVFLRSGDLDVRALSTGAGWAVTNTAAGEWIEFESLDFSAGNYEFLPRYSTSTGGAQKRIALSLDGKSLAPVIVPQTANADSFVLTSLGQTFVVHGPHDLRVSFLDGLVDLDWLFVKKLDQTWGLKASTGKYLSANEGGGSTLNSNAPHAEIWEQFTFDDLNSGTLDDGDRVYLQTYNGRYMSSSAGTLNATKLAPGASEVFTVQFVSGTSFIQGTEIALLDAEGHYVTATAGSADTSGTSIADAQTFSLVDDH